MLTPIDIQQKTFKGKVGYNKDEVDDFMNTMLENYEFIYKENIDLNSKITNLTQALQQYKNIEKSLQKALILAQKAAEEVKDNAHASAKLIEEEAHAKAEKIVFEAKQQLSDITAKINKLQDNYNTYKAQVKQLANTQLEIIDTTQIAFDTNAITDNNSEKLNIEKIAAKTVEEKNNNSIKPLESIDKELTEEAKSDLDNKNTEKEDEIFSEIEKSLLS